jgi:hypothetical protein
VLASYVLRVVPAAAAEGRLVGEVESVASGESRTIRDIADLVAFVAVEQLHTAATPSSLGEST